VEHADSPLVALAQPRAMREGHDDYAVAGVDAAQRHDVSAFHGRSAALDAIVGSAGDDSRDVRVAPADNAAAEAFNATLKRETLQGRGAFTNEHEARLTAGARTGSGSGF
jgi:hypothetical protein